MGMVGLISTGYWSNNVIISTEYSWLGTWTCRQALRVGLQRYKITIWEIFTVQVCSVTQMILSLLVTSTWKGTNLEQAHYHNLTKYYVQTDMKLDLNLKCKHFWQQYYCGCANVNGTLNIRFHAMVYLETCNPSHGCCDPIARWSVVKNQIFLFLFFKLLWYDIFLTIFNLNCAQVWILDFWSVN